MSPADNQPDETLPQPTFRDWLAANGVTLAILGSLFVFLWVKFDSDGLLAIFKAALGLGLVIFIHELGHFLAAKWCDVHVTTFSVGFGPPIPGCHFKWGETTYKLALLPLGGYVQMVGQVDGDEGSDEASEEDPRSFRNKGVGARMLIISAGVIMNVILAVICFIVVFRGPGKDRKAGVIDKIDTGAPAFIAGAKSGDAILQIGDVRDPYFEDLMVTVMGTTSGDRLDFIIADPGAKKGDRGYRELEIEPRKTSSDSRPIIGISPPSTAQLDSRRYYGKTMKHPALPNTAAAKASPQFEFGDRIIATTDPDDPSKVTDLPMDPRKPNTAQRDYFEFARRMSVLAGKEVVLRVEREGGGTVDVKLPPAFHNSIGARMAMGRVTAVRKKGPAETSGVEAIDPANSRNGDLIEWVAVRQPDGRVTVWGPVAAPFSFWGAVEIKPLDPYRLPDELLAWSRSMARAGKGDARTVTIHVERHSKKAGNEAEKATLKLTWDPSYENNKEIPMGVNAGMSVPGLGLAYRVAPKVASVEPTIAQRGKQVPNPLRPGDVIKDVRYHTRETPDAEAKWYPWLAEKAGKTELDGEKNGEKWAYWTAVGLQLLRSHDFDEVEFWVERDGKKQDVRLVLEPASDWGLEERGLLLAPDLRRQYADSMGEAVLLGLKDTKNSIIQVYQNLRGMIVGRISVDNLGGPVTIARVAYHFAGIDFWEFVFFLGLISVNLAVINFLPIPVLDGGHMVFLIYEKLRGKPASEGVRVGATYVGLLMLASLMIFVLFLDIKRLF